MRYGNLPGSKQMAGGVAIGFSGSGAAGAAGGRRSSRASSGVGHSVSRWREVLSFPHEHRSGGSVGSGSDGVVPVCSWKSARSEAGLCFLSVCGKSVEGAIGKSGSAGCLSAHSVSIRRLMLACNQLFVTLGSLAISSLVPWNPAVRWGP